MEQTEPRWRRLVTPAALALVVVAVLFAAWSGWSWFSAAHDDSIQYATTRDDVQRAAEVGIANFNTLDYKKVDQGLDTWLQSSTGDLHKEIQDGRDASKKQIQDAKTTTTAKVLDAAVTELDDRAGKAKVIAGVQLTVTQEGSQPSPPKYNRLEAELTRTDAGWKLSALGQVPAGGA